MKIWREELDDFVPPRVLDMHVHIFDRATVPEGEAWSCAGHLLTHYDYDEFRADLDAFYPGRHTEALCFGTPWRELDRQANNAYLAAHADHRRFFPLRLFDPNEPDPEAVRADLQSGRFLGIKPYLNYVIKDDPNLVEIPEMLPDWVMEIVDEAGLIVMLHIPRKERLADPLNRRQVRELCQRFPGARIVLAHVGRAYFLSNIEGYIEELVDLENLWYDLAMLNNWEVMEYLFARASADRILYATDAPIALAPGKSVEINNQYTYITPEPWRLSIHDATGRVAYTSFLYEELRAIKKAVARGGHDRRFVEKMFYDNGRALIDSVRAACQGWWR